MFVIIIYYYYLAFIITVNMRTVAGAAAGVRVADARGGSRASAGQAVCGVAVPIARPHRPPPGEQTTSPLLIRPC